MHERADIGISTVLCVHFIYIRRRLLLTRYDLMMLPGILSRWTVTSARNFTGRSDQSWTERLTEAFNCRLARLRVGNLSGV